MLLEAEEIVASQRKLLQDYFAGCVSLRSTVEGLESLSIFQDTSPESGLSRLWSVILREARSDCRNHDKLVDIVVSLSKRSSPRTAQGATVVVYKMEVWKNLPMLGWEFRDHYNFSVNLGAPPDHRQEAVREFVNMNRFAALLKATGEEVFNYSWFALITLREALETKQREAKEIYLAKLNAWLPAAAAWIEILGVEIFEWDEEFPSEFPHGAPGSGGDLWNGKHGFCEERWHLWRERFAGLAKSEKWAIEDDVRRVAGEAAIMMGEIEEGNIE